MILRIAWRREGFDRPQTIVVSAAWPYGEWLAYRKPGTPGVTHYIPGSAVWEIITEEGPGDPDPKNERTPAQPTVGVPVELPVVR